MFNKLYEAIKKIIKENGKFFLLLIMLLALTTIELPYYVDTPGGIIDISSKMKIEDGYPSKGSLNLAYVSERKGTIPILLLAKLKKDWNIVKKEEIILENETVEENNYRNRLLLEEANNNAIIIAYQKAGKKVEIQNQKLYVTYVDSTGKTDLKIKDQIIQVNGKKVNNKIDLQNAIFEKKVGDVIPIKVIRNEKEIDCTAEIYKREGREVIGIVLSEQKEIKVDPTIQFSFDPSESGPSGGLMMSLAIYNALVKEDITKGYTIVGTGTMERDGTVGEIGGVEYKLKGAVKEKADFFFVPAKDNYNEAIKLKNENHYDIEIVSVSTFEEALEYLRTLDFKK